MNDLVQLDFFAEDNVIELEDDSIRTCTECNEEKPLDAFPNDPTIFKGKRHQCRICTNGHTAVVSMLRKRNRYPDENYRCPICNTSRWGIRRRNGTSWVLDNCHNTNQFRGWLCENCNSGIGKLKDSVELLYKAIKYLEGDNKDAGS